MPLQPAWDKYETALLLDLCLRVHKGEINRKDGVAQLSALLRKRAIDRGIAIDDVYRNETGISMQLYNMERLVFMTNGAERNSSVVFDEIVEMYRNDRKQYETILAEAKDMIMEQKPKQDAAEMFAAWLKERMSAEKLSDLWSCYPDIEEFCQRVHVLKQPLFEVTDITGAKAVLNAVQGNRLFRLEHKKRMNTYVMAAQYFVNFIKQKPAAGSDKTTSSTEVETKSTPQTTYSLDELVDKIMVVLETGELKTNKAPTVKSVEEPVMAATGCCLLRVIMKTAKKPELCIL